MTLTTEPTKKSDWTYQGAAFTDAAQYVGFVYVITNTVVNRHYIGKKLFTKAKTTQSRGRKRRTRTESDWVNYWGSNQHVHNDQNILGNDSFQRRIIYLCTSKGTLSYLEAETQMQLNVLGSDRYYNGIINCRISESHVRKLDTDRQTADTVLLEELRNDRRQLLD